MSAKRAKFRVGQTAVIRGLDVPHGCVKILREEEPDVWAVSVELDGRVQEVNRTSGELRHQTRREKGDAR